MPPPARAASNRLEIKFEILSSSRVWTYLHGGAYTFGALVLHHHHSEPRENQSFETVYFSFLLQQVLTSIFRDPFNGTVLPNYDTD